MADVDPKLAKTVNVHEAKTHLSKLLERVHAGEEIIVAKAGRPYAKLVPFTPPGPKKKRREPGGLEQYGPIPDSFFEPLPDDMLDAWEGKYSSF
jgi:prevent-host-death family protein